MWVRPLVGTIPWRRAWQPTSVFLAGESHGQRSLADIVLGSQSRTRLKRLSSPWWTARDTGEGPARPEPRRGETGAEAARSTGLSSVREALSGRWGRRYIPVVQGSEAGGLSGGCSGHEDGASAASQLSELSRRAAEPAAAVLPLPWRNARGSLPNRGRPLPACYIKSLAECQHL